MLSPSRSLLYITCHPAGPACLADGLKCAQHASITSTICLATRDIHSSEADIGSDGSELPHADSGDRPCLFGRWSQMHMCTSRLHFINKLLWIREIHSSEADVSSDGSELPYADSGDDPSSCGDGEGRSNQSGPPSGAESSGDDGALAARRPGRRLRQNDIKPLRPAGEAQQEAAEEASMQRQRDDKGQTSRQHAEEPPARSPSLSSEEQGEYPRLLLACWQKDEELTAIELLSISGICSLVQVSLSRVIAPLCRTCDVDRSLLLYASPETGKYRYHGSKFLTQWHWQVLLCCRSTHGRGARTTTLETFKLLGKHSSLHAWDLHVRSQACTGRITAKC